MSVDQTLADHTPVIISPTTPTAPLESIKIQDCQSANIALIHSYKECLFTLAAEPKASTAKKAFSQFVSGFRRPSLLFIPGYRKQFDHDELLAKYVGLVAVLECSTADRFLTQAIVGLKLLSVGKLEASQSTYEEIEFRVSSAAALSYVMRGIGSFLRSMIVVIFIFGYFIMLPLVVKDFKLFGTTVDWSTFTGFYSTHSDGFATLGEICLAAITGMLGSVVSLLLRLNEFENTKDKSQIFLVLTGATLPIVGGIFAAFVAALLSSKLINVSIGSANGGINVWLFAVIGFLCGFSERFSRGFITAAEQQLGSGFKAPDNNPNPATSPTSQVRKTPSGQQKRPRTIARAGKVSSPSEHVE